MKQILFTIQYLLFTFICSAQTYEWQPLPEGIYGTPLGTTRVESMVALTDTNLMYVAGNFDSAGSLPCSGFAIWNGLNFSIFNGGPWITMSTYQNQIAAAGGTPAKLIYLIDNLIFTLIGQANSDIHSLIEYKGDLYAGGDFTNMDGVPCNGIARWDGTSWHPCGTGVTVSGGASVDALGVYNGKLYVGGYFEFAGGIPAWNLAAWDSTNWQSIGIGTSQTGNYYAGSVMEMGTFNNKLFIAGLFNEVNGLYTSPLAYTDGVNWFPTNNSGLGFIYDIKEFENKLFMATTPYQVYTSNDGVNFTLVGSLFNGNIKSLEVFNDTLYAAGGFEMCGGTPCYRIARLVQLPDDTTGVSQLAVGSMQLVVYPNPVERQLTVVLRQAHHDSYAISITDLLGRQLIVTKPANTKTEIDVTALSAGVYLLMVEGKNGIVGVSKFIKQ